ncbi:MAG TPA: hypothetical protein O0Y06_06410 [Methanocorpusculum sp.]|nr:hypothetical protein [Methanocorpusculum sp.]
MIDKRDEMYAGEPVEKVAAIGSDVLIPLDLMNVVNKTVTGRGEQLTTEDYVGAAIDTASIILGVFTGGVGYVGLKAAKTGVKGVTKMVPKISKNSKLKTPMPRKAAPKKVSAPKKVTKKTTNKPAPSIKSRGTTRKVNRRTARATKKTVAPARVNTVKKSTVKNTKAKAAKATSSKPKVTKAKTPAAAAPPRGILGTLTDLSSIALTGLMAWMMLGPSEEEVYDDGYYDDGLYDDGYGTSEDSGLLPAEEPYYDETGEEYYDSPILPEELQPLEEYAEDLSGYIEDVPVIGDIAEEARKRGLSLPFLIAIGAVAFIGGRWVWKKYKASKKHPAKKPAAATKKPVAGRKSAAGKKRGTAA